MDELEPVREPGFGNQRRWQHQRAGQLERWLVLFVGGEYDYSPVLTLRSGVAYELSPEDDPTKRFTIIPDNNRVWLNFGASYKLPDNLFPWSQSTTIDIAYAHVFVQDGAFDRPAVVIPDVTVSGKIDASADLISVGMRTRW